MPAGGHAPGSLSPRRKPRPQRRTRHVDVANVAARSIVRTARSVSRPQPRRTPPPPVRSQNRPPAQIVRQRAVRKAGAPARRKIRQQQLRDTQRRRRRAPLTHRGREPLGPTYNRKVAAQVRDAQLLAHRPDPPGPFSTQARRTEALRVARLPKSGVLTPFLRRLTHPTRGQVALIGQAQNAAASGIVPRATVQLHGDPKKVGQYGLNFLKDPVEIAANAPGALYNVGAAGVEALQGDTKRAKQIFHGLKEHDPIFLAAQGRFKEAGHEIGQHPVSFALEALGAKASVGRSVGAAERAGGATREASAAVLEGTRIRVRRPYSKDAVTRRRQIAQDRRKTKQAQEFERKAQQSFRDGAYEQAIQYRHKAREASPVHVSDKEVRRRVDERNDANEQVRRTFRGRAIQRASKHKIPERRGGHLVSLVAQGVVHADRRDIAAYLQELDHQYRSGVLTQAQRAANRNTAAKIKAALESKHLDLARVKKAAEGFARDQERAEGALIDSGLLDARQAEKARLIPYAVRRMGARHSTVAGNDIGRRVGELEQVFNRHAREAKQHIVARDRPAAEAAWAHAEAARGELDGIRSAASGGERLIGPDGRYLSSEAIKTHMRANHVDPDTIAYLSQAPNARGAKNFYMNTLQRNVIASPVRTGEATRHGTFDTHPDTLIEQASRVANLHAADHGYKGLVGEFAIRRPDSGDVQTFSTKRGADLFIRDQHAHGARPMRAIRVNPFTGKKKDLEALLEHVNEGTETPTGLLDAMQAAIRGEDGAGPWAVIHETAAHRIQEHLGLQNPMVGLKGLQKVNQAFRNTVLPTSTKWLTGNLVEGAFRTALARAGPMSFLTGRRTFAQLDDLVARGVIPEGVAVEARARAVGGGHYSMAERTSVHRDSRQFEHSVLRPVARALGAFARAPGPRHLGMLWHTYTHFVFKANTLLVEVPFQTALAGKYVRDMLPTKGELSISQKAVEQAARGLTNTNEQVAMARYVDRAYGKYSKFNPAERALVAYYTPFIAWSLNAVKFVGSVLPKDHPVFTGLLAAAHNASDEWLKDHGLNLWIENAAPGWLQGSIPTSGGGKIRAGRYLPFGFFSDPAQSVASVVLPQYMGAIFALNGLDWKGDPLNGPGSGEPNPGQKFGTALGQFFGATVPVLGQLKAYGEKEGPVGQRLNRQFNPFYPVQPTKKKESSGSGWGGGGSSNGGWGG